MPYSFSGYVDDVEDALDRMGIQIASQEYAVTKTHDRFFGCLEIEPKPLQGELITSDEWKLLVGLRGSHDQKVSRGLVLGTQVITCSNLMFSGNIAKFASKQTLNLGSRLPGLIRDAVMRIPEMARAEEARFDQLKNYEVRPRVGDAGLVQMFLDGGLSSAQLGRAIHEWREPSFEKHEEQGWSGWRLLNAGTQALKPTGANTNSQTVADRSRIVSDVANQVCHIN
jgi:hypothetical protein